MSRDYDTVIVGGSADGLVCATALARAGSRVLLLEARDELGGTLRELEFAPGYRAAPLAADAGHVDAEVIRATGLSMPAKVSAVTPALALGDGNGLALHRSVGATCGELRRYSERDAAAWPEFARRIAALSGFLGSLYRQPPPAVEPGSVGDYLELLRAARSFRALGRADMADLLRALAMPVADLLDDCFESPALKGLLGALAVSDLCLGPMSGGTAFALLHRQVGAPEGAFGERLRLAAGAQSLVAALEERARAAGVTIRTGAKVAQWIVEDERVAGARLESGEEIRSASVVSALDPQRSLLEMLDPGWLDPDLVAAVQNIRHRGVTSYLLLALDSLPEVPGIEGPPAGSLWIAPTLREVERAYDAAKYGRCSEEPVIELRFPSVLQPALAPAGRHVGLMRVQYTPWRLREGDWSGQRDPMADGAIALVESRLPGFATRIRARRVLTPADLDAEYGLCEGAASRGEALLDQMLFMRPVGGAAHYAMPMPGLYLCGAATHPGPGMTGMSGLLAARTVRAG